MKQEEEHIEQLISKYLLEEATPDERQQVDQWRNASAENEAQFIALQKTLVQTTDHLVGEVDLEGKIDVEREWELFQVKVEKSQSTGDTKIIPLHAQAWARIAASIVLLAVVGFAILQMNKSSEKITYLAKTSGEVVELPDGSTVTLNANSEVTYPRSFEDLAFRNITFRGEAFFDIKRDESKAFNIELAGASVQVLGTSFNIAAYDDNAAIDVVVASGKVKLTSASANESIILNKGDRGTFDKGDNQLLRSVNNDVNYLAWKTGELYFEEAELAQVVATLNKLYDAQISIAATSASNCQVTVSFSQQSLEAILTVLEATLGLTYDRQEGSIIIVKTGC